MHVQQKEINCVIREDPKLFHFLSQILTKEGKKEKVNDGCIPDLEKVKKLIIIKK